MSLPVTVPTTVLVGLLLLAGCSSQPPGTTSQSYSNDHTTAAGGFGLGPEDFKTNGGAFGPDQGSASDSLSKPSPGVR